MKSGIYKIVNVITGRMYIGSAVNFFSRRASHRSHLAAKKHHCRALQRAYNKYGVDFFVFRLIEECESNKLIEREQIWMNTARKNGITLYNSALVAGNNKGLIHSADARARISEAQKGRVMSAETRAKISAAHKGRPKSPEHIANAAAAQRGRKLSPELRKINSERLRKLNAERTGKPQAEWINKKISEALKGRKFTPEQIQEHAKIKSKMTALDVFDILMLKKSGWTQREIGEKYRVHQSVISKMLAGKRMFYRSALNALRQ